MSNTPMHRVNGRTTNCTRCFGALRIEEIPGSPVRQTTTMGFSLRNVEEFVVAGENKRIYPRVRLCDECSVEFRKFMGEDWGQI